MFASDSVSLPRLDNPTGACPTHRKQWADFLLSLMAPLHRHRLRAVMFCSEVPIRDTHKSPTNCLPGCGHDPRSAPNLERHGSSKMQTFGWLEMPHSLIRISSYIPSEIEKYDFLSYYFSQQKGQPVSCGSPFFFINSLNRLHALRRLKAQQINTGLKYRLCQL